MGLEICPMTLREANAFVSEYHRHHGPTTGHKFSIGLKKKKKIVGEQGEYKKTQKSGPGTNYVYFWEFKECKVVCFPHPSGARIKVGVIEKYKNEMQEIFKKFKEIKKIS